MLCYWFFFLSFFIGMCYCFLDSSKIQFKLYICLFRSSNSEFGNCPFLTNLLDYKLMKMCFRFFKEKFQYLSSILTCLG